MNCVARVVAILFTIVSSSFAAGEATTNDYSKVLRVALLARDGKRLYHDQGFQARKGNFMLSVNNRTHNGTLFEVVGAYQCDRYDRSEFM